MQDAPKIRVTKAFSLAREGKGIKRNPLFKAAGANDPNYAGNA